MQYYVHNSNLNQYTPLNNSHNRQQGAVSWLLLLFAVALIIVSVIISIFVYKHAYQKGYHDANKEAKIVTDGIEMNADGLKSIQLENEILKNEADTAKQERDITLNNLIELRKRIDELKITNLQLKQTNKLYGKSIARQGGIPLQIIGAKIEPLPENAFEYRFDVLKLAKDGKSRTLKPRIELLNSTSFVNIPVKPSRYDIAGVARIRGRFIMPEGFSPKQLRLKLKAGDENLEQIYNWKLGKRKNNIPLSLSEVPETDQRPIN